MAKNGFFVKRTFCCGKVRDRTLKTAKPLTLTIKCVAFELNRRWNFAPLLCV